MVIIIFSGIFLAMSYPSEIKVGEKFYAVSYELTRKYTSSVRFRKGGVAMKLSRFVPEAKRDEMVESFLKWAKKRLEKITDELIVPVYEDGGRICTHNKIYDLEVHLTKRRNSVARMKDSHIIQVFLMEELTLVEQKRKVKILVDDLIIKDQESYLFEVIEELNQLYFQERVNEIRFKKVNSRFGSCSSRRNINIAFRLLFAPREVFRYVCVHELAHLKEMNHSRKFWAWVEFAMPEYRECEKWLSNNGFVLG